MKKIVFAILVSGFAWAVAFAWTASAEELEKIPSPDQVPYYQVMRRENGVLYGIKLKNQEQQRLATSTSQKLERIASPEELKNFKVIKKEDGILFGIRIKETEEKQQGLEKISTPSLLPLYENVKKIGTALWGVKKKASSTPASVKPARVAVTSESLTCVQSAITSKDAALIINVKQAAEAAEAAISARSQCQKAALERADGQFAALDNCLRSFKESVSKMQKEQRDSHQQAWNEYRAALKSCQPVTSIQEKAAIIIEDGGVSSDNLLSGAIIQ